MTMPSLPADPGTIRELLAEVQTVPQLPVPDIPYNRMQDFGEAPTVETRQEILQRDMSNVILNDRGHVISGTEIDPYSGQQLISPHEVQVDHIVPLQMAWDMGADHWSWYKRNEFANDHDELWAVSGTQNQAKGWAGPGDWLPPNTAEDPDYVERYLKIDAKYGLPITAKDRAAIERVVGEMPMTSPTPPPLHILQGYGDHLSALQQSADTHRVTADTWDQVFQSQQSQVTGLPWTGQGADAARSSVNADTQVVSQQSDQLRQAAQVTEQALPELRSSFNAVMQKVQQIQGDKFQVTDTYGVQDTMQTTDVLTLLQRQEKAEAHAAELTTLVGKFWQQELSTSSRLAALSNVHDFKFPGQGIVGNVPDRWHTTQWDDPSHAGGYEYDADHPCAHNSNQCTQWEIDHGANFNPNIKIDTSMASTSGPPADTDPQWLDRPPMRPDWPAPLVGAPVPTDQTGSVVSPFFLSGSRP